MVRKRSSAVMAVAAKALADAVEQDHLQDSEPDEDPEVMDGVLEGLRRLDQGDGAITWYVYNNELDNGGYIERLRTEQLDEDLFKQRYGPGEYRVRGRDASGQYVKGASTTVKISGVLGQPRRPSNGAESGNESAALALMREMQAANDRRNQQRAEDNRHWAQALAVPFATVAAAFISRPRNDVAALVTALRPQQSSLSEMTQALVSLQALQGDKSSTVDVLLKVLDRVKDMPEPSGEGGWLGLVRDVVREAAPHARDLLSRMNNTVTPSGLLPASATTGPAFGPGIRPVATTALPAAPATPSSPSPHGAAPQTIVGSPSQQTSAGADDMWTIAEPWLRRRAEELHEDAAANMDCELVAEALLERARKRFGMLVSLEQLLQMLQHPQWWEFLTSFYPPIAPYQSWVNDVRGQLIVMIAEDLGTSPPQPSEATKQ